MNNETNLVSNEDLRAAFEGEKKPRRRSELAEPKQRKAKGLERKILGLLIVGIIGIVGGGAMLLVALLGLSEERQALSSFPDLKRESEEEVTYSALTGEKLADKALLTAPAYCVQTPNGTDGARPQSGLNEAGVIFEAIAEAGITRFAAIYQNPSAAVIGPIRSLRMYYLEWDTPFDCTIVHAGGADDALAAVAAGGYKDLSEDYSYMYRGTYGARAWNNLFTTAALLRKYSSDSGNNSSEIKGFARMTPSESGKARVDETASEKLVITKPAEGDTSKTEPKVTAINLRFGGIATFNVNYTYDAATNKYLRGYDTGDAHNVYGCTAEDLGEKNPEDVCTLTQMTPSVVVAMIVNERKASDNYHENIDTIGSGDAYIFQNGVAIRGKWNKASKADQIKFTDNSGSEIKLAPGQTIVSAIPSYGSVDF